MDRMDEKVRTLADSVALKGLNLAESKQWRPYTAQIREGYRKKNKVSIPNDRLATTVTLLENTRTWMNHMNEATRVVNIGNFVDYGFDLISATIPNLIAPDLVSVQALEQRHGAIFYLDYLYGNTKGSVQQGQVMNSPFTGSNSEFNFSNDVIEGETLGTGDGAQDSFSTTLGYTPVRTGTVSVYVGGALAAQVASTANGIDTLAAVAGSGVTGTVNLDTGAVSVSCSTAPANGVLVTAGYRYNMDTTTVGFSQVNLDLKSMPIEAFPRKLRALWLLDAGYDLKSMKGIDAENELVVAMSSQIKHEIDGEVLSKLYSLAGNTGYTWSAQNPTSSLSYQEYKRTIIDMFTEASNDIFVSTKRVGANFIVAGTDVCTIIETLEEFDNETLGTKTINGPHYIGTLAGKWKVYKNPYYTSTNFILGYKGDSWMDAGYVYAPYLPLYTTPTTVLDDFVFRKGLATSYGQAMINNNLYAKGSITDFTPGRVVPA